MATKYIPQKSTKAERSATNKQSNREQLQVPCKTADVSWIRWKLEPCLNIACQRDEHAQDVSMKKKTLFARLQLKETRFILLRPKWLTYVLANDSTGYWNLQRIFKCTRVSNSRPVNYLTDILFNDFCGSQNVINELLIDTEWPKERIYYKRQGKFIHLVWAPNGFFRTDDSETGFCMKKQILPRTLY